MAFGPENTLRIALVFQGLAAGGGHLVAFLTWLAASPQDFSVENAVRIASVPARHF
jgi:hypothetical protein